jgi:hypothetical protein
MLGGHLIELFDHWDHVLQTGRDTASPVVIVAASLGVVFAAIKKFVSIFRQLFTASKSLEILPSPTALLSVISEPLATGPPPPSLNPIRI